MKQLTKDELNLVTGSNYLITIVATVPDTLDAWVSSMVNNINSGAINNPNGAINAPYTFSNDLKIANAANINFASIQIESVAFTNINS
jgi:hypothetical protein